MKMKVEPTILQTKREVIAINVLNSIVSDFMDHPVKLQDALDTPKRAAQWAVSFADALIEELDKKKDETLC